MRRLNVTRKLFESHRVSGSMDTGEELATEDPVGALESSREAEVHNKTRKRTYTLRHELSPRQIDVIRAGSLINPIRAEDP